MRFYEATRFLFPRSFELRVLCICCLAVHVPLIVCVAVQAATGEWRIDVLLILLAATLAGTVAGIVAIRALLSPLGQAVELLRLAQDGERIDRIPPGSEDLVGRLLVGVAKAANTAADRIDRLALVAKSDPLTGLYNRRGFFAAADEALAPGHASVLALIDLDHFKRVNDRLGHMLGDELLCAFAERLRDGVRRLDVCARWGGEEFAVLFPNATLDDARDVLDRLRRVIGRDLLPEAEDIVVTFSCGLAPIRTHDQLSESARRADEALYAAKHAGRDRILVAQLP
jgi:diguanylate cyclase (GGDEF)-like protein